MCKKTQGYSEVKFRIFLLLVNANLKIIPSVIDIVLMYYERSERNEMCNVSHDVTSVTFLLESYLTRFYLIISVHIFETKRRVRTGP